MRNIRLTISYDGTGYCGWQVQPNGVTIQELIEGAIAKMRGALQELVIDGIHTNAPLHFELMNDGPFRDGGVSIHYLEQWLEARRTAAERSR